MKFIRLLIILLILVAVFGLAAQSVSANIIRTGRSELEGFENTAPASVPGLAVFVHSLDSRLPDQVAGIYIPGVMAFPVVQQPLTNASFVSNLPDTLTQFRMAAQYHTIGLLAHDYLAGSFFPELKTGMDIYLVNGNANTKVYRVYQVQKYQALSPTDPYSSFIDLTDQTKFSADQLFYHTYGLGNDTLILQTCISTPSVPSWGRIFILARPLEPSRPAAFWEPFPWFTHTQPTLAGQ